MTSQQGYGAEQPDLYEVLGVDREASAGTIRKAWRRRTDKARPGTDEFRRLNEAAETLLDPRRRLEYDASLPVPDEPESVVATAGTSAQPGVRPARRRGPWTWAAMGVLLVLTVVAAVFAGVYTAGHRQDEAVEQARTRASDAAQRALAVILSYDYRHMSRDRQQALGYLTAAYAKEYSRNFALLTEGRGGKEPPVDQTKTVVRASVLGTGVMDAAPHEVHVMAFVNQQARHRAGPRQQECSPACVLTNRVEVTMVQRGDRWLVDGLNPK